MDDKRYERGGSGTPAADQFPEARAVLDHGFDFRPQWWRDRTPDAWSAFLSGLPVARRGRGYHRITRGDLISLGRQEFTEANCALLIACYAWGTGSSAFLVPRRARVFRDTPPDELDARLADARRLLAVDGAAAAYESLDGGGPNRIKHMRASFFTKFLYAADAGTHEIHKGGALILDQFVAIALNKLHGWNLATRGPWSADTYQRWIELAEAQAAAASEAVGHPVRPDAVELTYFRYGRTVAQARKEGRGANP
jgi:hypothetical protein